MELHVLLCILFYMQFSHYMTTIADDTPLQDLCPTAPKAGKNLFFFNGYPCKNPGTVTASDFKTSKLNHAGDTDNFLRSSTNILTATEFPGLNTMGLSIARTDLAMDGTVLPHSHPRASEMLYVSLGTVTVGFSDTKNGLFHKTVKEGDVFVVPRGMLHFCFNAGYGLATVYSMLNSQNPGLVNIAGAMFPGLDAGVSERLVAQMMNLKAMSAIYNNMSGIESTGFNATDV